MKKDWKNLKNKEKNIQEEEKKLFNKKINIIRRYKKVNDLRNKVSSLQKENNLLEDVAKQRTKARNELLKNLNPILGDYMKEKKLE